MGECETSSPVRVSFADFVASRLARLNGLALLVIRNREESQDAVQDALTALLPRWDELPCEPELDRYVNRAVVNACLKRLRGLRRVLPVADLPWEPSAVDGDPAPAVVLARHAWELCAELPPEQRVAVVLRFYQDLSFAEIAEVLGCREATARSHVHRAVTMLRLRYGEEAR